MKKTTILFALVIMVITSCSNKQKLVGAWIDNEGELWVFTGEGYLKVEGERMVYSITPTQLSLSVDGDNVVFNYSISSDGKTLLLNNTWQGSLTLAKSPPPVILSEKRWVDGSITPKTRAVAYSFNAVTGKTYFIWTNDDSEGNGSKSLDIKFSVFDENDGYDGDDDCWSDPCRFTVSKNSRVTIVAYAYDENETGTFAIAYTTSPTRP
jgi:hypothetical protein